ncbi:hypothetical protein APR04_000081 [Promicromonospora umidemergens]|uniref:Uncharacterized protein n=1 Tax=Promicromonospora umidemergens TaxID=629679 RepID=A0ABP8X475_9MICO|nr:hypothetical protein [Promicromonospora umidemergens]MCP2281192.1 hypothetical protein [Promicromonospora umidemergens]
MLHNAVLAAEAAAEHADEPIAPIVLGLIAFGALLVALLVTFAFRNVGNRH